jgi:hypothetical protein
VVLVVHEADGDAALDRRLEGREHGVARRLLESQVIDADVEGLGRAVEE